MLKTVSSITNAIGALNYRGTWNASTNIPALTSGVGTKGDYYVVSVAGSTSLDGVSTWYVGDWATFNGSAWQRLEGGVDDPAPSIRSNSTTGVMQVNGPAAGSTRVMTVPDANFTAARTDAAQSFSGTQTFDAVDINSGQLDSVNIGGATRGYGYFNDVQYDPRVSLYNQNIRESGTFNDGIAHSFSSWGASVGVVYIKAGVDGITAIPFFPNGGGGVGFTPNILDPDSGLWVYGNTVTFTTGGVSANSYSVTISNGAGQVIVQRTGGTTEYSVYIQILSVS